MLSVVFLIVFNVMVSADPNFEATPFYSTPVSDIELDKVELKTNAPSVSFEKKGLKKFVLNLDKKYSDIYKKLPDSRKKIIVKLASLGVLSKSYLSKKENEAYSLLYKKNHAFNLETLAVVPMGYKEALPIIRDYASYNDWAIKNINVRRNGEKGKYFVEINSLKYIPGQKFFNTSIRLNTILSGDYWLDLMILDHLDETDPYLTLKMREASKLAKDVQGTFYFLVPVDEQYYILYFSGRTEVNWALYNFLPLALVRTQVVERVYTVLDNIRYKAENSKQSK